MPDLGPRAVYVLLSYGVTLVLLAAIIGLSARRAIKVRRALEEIENG
nr:heme exporter protein CcmD [Loktanella fryxellensis]